MSFGHPQLAHNRSAHVTRKGRIYYYRRRLPAILGGEVALSLRTDCYRKAEHFAARLDAKLAACLSASMSPKDLPAILREHLDDLRRSYAEQHRNTRVGRSVFGLSVSDDDDPVETDIDFASTLAAEDREAISRREWRSVERQARSLMKEHSIAEEHFSELCEGLLAAHAQVLDEFRERLLGRVSLPTGRADIAVVTSLQRRSEAHPSSAPMLSEAIGPFLEHSRGKNDSPWASHDVTKARAVYSLFVDWLGDRPLNEYKRSEVYAFYEALAELPSNHGKSAADRGRTMRERISHARTAIPDAPRISAKTMKGYGTRLIALFDHYRDVDDAHWSNPAGGYDKFDEHGRGSKSRAAWTGEPLQKLLAAPVWTGCSSEARPNSAGEKIIANERYWLPLLAMYHGARLEELARLVRAEVREENGIAYLDITDEHPQGVELNSVIRKNRLKTLASRRRVPIHRAVLDLGFLQYVGRVAPKPGDLLFPRLLPDLAKDGQRGGKFSKWFTRYRRQVGVSNEALVFHSFRATVATKLLSVASDELAVIIALIGHEADIAKAVTAAPTLFGNYTKVQQIPLEALAATINKVQYREASALRRPTEFGDGSPFPET